MEPMRPVEPVGERATGSWWARAWRGTVLPVLAGALTAVVARSLVPTWWIAIVLAVAVVGATTSVLRAGRSHRGTP